MGGSVPTIDVTVVVEHGIGAALNAAGAGVGLSPLCWELQIRPCGPGIVGAVRGYPEPTAHSIVYEWAQALRLPYLSDDHGETEATGSHGGLTVTVWAVSNHAALPAEP